MKIKKLKLTNIGIHKELDVEFGEFTTISGANAEGKTTIDNALIEAIEGSDVPLLSNDEESGSIEVMYDNDLSVKIPFRKDGKDSPIIRQGNTRIEKPRTQLKEWHNDARIRAIDFFDGKGADQKKYQTDTIMSILDIKLDKKEIEEITRGELPLEDFFYGEHPLSYIKRLVNEKDGYYYKMRAKNNEGVQTITHSNNTLYDKICQKLGAVKIDPVLFDPDSYRSQSVVEKVQILKDRMNENALIESSKVVVAGYHGARKALEAQKAEEKETFGKTFQLAHWNKIESIQAEIAELQAKINKLNQELGNEKHAYNSKLDHGFHAIDIKFDGQFKALDTNLETAKSIVERPVHDITALQDEVNELQAVKEILPVYDTWQEGVEQYASMKAESDNLTEIIETLRKLPRKILQREKLPITGLSMNDDGDFVIINSHGTPVKLSQLSGFERLQLSLDVSIARLGEIRVLIIPQWAEIDDNNKAKIKAYLKSKDVQGVAIEVGIGAISVGRE